MTKSNIAFIITFVPLAFFLSTLIYLKYRKIKSKGFNLYKTLLCTINLFSPLDYSLPLEEDIWILKLLGVVMGVWITIIFFMVKFW